MRSLVRKMVGYVAEQQHRVAYELRQRWGIRPRLIMAEPPVKGRGDDRGMLRAAASRTPRDVQLTFTFDAVIEGCLT